MRITHQTLMDENGKPVAAQIPWEEFEAICDRLATEGEGPLSPEWRDELDRRVQSIKDGTAKLIPHEQVMSDVGEQLRSLSVERQSA